MKVTDIISESKQSKEAPKPRNFVAKNAINTGAGQHKDKKRAEKQGDVKHKKQAVPMDEEAGAATTSAGNVAVGAIYKNKPAKQAKNKDGTAKNALDINANLITGGSIKR